MSLDSLRNGFLVVVLLATTTACSAAQPPETITADDFILDEVSDFQREILQDGEVTAAEYEMSVLALRDCYEQLGMEVGPIINENDVLGFEALADYQNAADPDAEDTRISDGVKSCHKEYSDEVGLVWEESLIVTDPKERERLLTQVRDCINDTGKMSVSADAEYTQIHQEFADLQEETQDLSSLDPVRQCIDQVDSQLKPSLLTYQETTS